MDPELQKRAQQKASELGISFAEYVRRLVSHDLGEPKRKVDVSVVFDLVDEGPATDIARDKDKMIGEAKTQAHGIIVEARGIAEKERALAMEKTRQEQEELLERARREIRDERDRAVAELRREAVDLSLAAASRLIERRLDGETDRKLVLEFLAGMDDKP